MVQIMVSTIATLFFGSICLFRKIVITEYEIVIIFCFFAVSSGSDTVGLFRKPQALYIKYNNKHISAPSH